MIKLDESEHSALEEFLHIFARQNFDSTPTVLTSRIRRTQDGQIIIPISVPGESPSHQIALLMSHKAEQIYKQTACRLVPGQCPEMDTTGKIYVWTGIQWSTLQ